MQPDALARHCRARIGQEKYCALFPCELRNCCRSALRPLFPVANRRFFSAALISLQSECFVKSAFVALMGFADAISMAFLITFQQELALKDVRFICLTVEGLYSLNKLFIYCNDPVLSHFSCCKIRMVEDNFY